MSKATVSEDDLRTALAAGLSPSQAAESLGVSASAITRAMRSHGIELRRERPGTSDKHQRLLDGADNTRVKAWSASESAIAKALEAAVARRAGGVA